MHLATAHGVYSFVHGRQFRTNLTKRYLGILLISLLLILLMIIFQSMKIATLTQTSCVCVFFFDVIIC